MAVPNIKISEQVKSELEEIRDDGGHTSFDSALREMLRVYEESNAGND